MALKAAWGEAALTELSRKSGFHTNQIRAWKEQLLAGAATSFASGAAQQRDHDLVKNLHATIGELTVERHSCLACSSVDACEAQGGDLPWPSPAGRSAVRAASREPFERVPAACAVAAS